MVTFLSLVAASVALAFSAQLARGYAARRRAHALAWACALALFGAASAAVAVGVAAGWSPVVFGVYWVAGALLNVPLLAVGQLLLLDRRRARLWWTLAAVFTIASVASTALAGFDTAALERASRSGTIPLGREVLGGTVAYALVGPFNATFVVVVAGSIWSAARSRRWSVLLIAAGVLIVAAGSSAVGAGRDALFAVLLTIGVSTMYAGFLATARTPQRAAAELPADDDPA